MTAHLLTIGDEILIGQIIDTNSAWMSQALNLAGVSVVGKSSVSDTKKAIVDGLQHARSQAQIVIMTGGLGPTKDDITKKTLAELFASDMRFDADTFQRIQSYFEKINRPFPREMAEHQAMVPAVATVLPNKVGTAPGMWFEQDGVVCISLPGVPFEMEYLMTHEVLPRLQQRFVSRPIAHRTLQTVGEGESNIAKRIESFEDGLPAHIKLAYLPALGQVRLRLTGVWPGEIVPDAAQQLGSEVEGYTQTLHALLQDLVFGAEDMSLQQAVGQLLQEKQLTFGTAESCTGGYIAHLITTVPGASSYFLGSAVTYSNEMKMKLLDVPQSILEAEGAVSEATVRAMATGARAALGVAVAVAVSGIAGPGGGTPEKPVGTVWVAVSDGRRTIAAKQIFGRDRTKNIHLSAIFALNMVRKFLLHES
jgi:nicotinamide-nucleotide amidase